MIKPIAYQKCFESKTNNAHLITFDNDKNYVIKMFKEEENKALINEWFAHCLARYLQLPVPGIFFAEMDEEFCRSNDQLSSFTYTSKQLAIPYLGDVVNAYEANIETIINDEQMARIIVFDYWLNNQDRTRKNVLLQEQEKGSYYLWAIDHAEILGSFEWQTKDLAQPKEKLIKSATHEMMCKFVKSEDELIEQIKIIQGIPTLLMEEIFSFLPSEWGLTKQEEKAAIDWLLKRREKQLPIVINKFIKKIYRPLHRRNSK